MAVKKQELVSLFHDRSSDKAAEAWIAVHGWGAGVGRYFGCGPRAACRNEPAGGKKAFGKLPDPRLPEQMLDLRKNRLDLANQLHRRAMNGKFIGRDFGSARDRLHAGTIGKRVDEN